MADTIVHAVGSGTWGTGEHSEQQWNARYAGERDAVGEIHAMATGRARGQGDYPHWAGEGNVREHSSCANRLTFVLNRLRLEKLQLCQGRD